MSIPYVVSFDSFYPVDLITWLKAGWLKLGREKKWGSGP